MLESFDIFDTLLTRATGSAEAVFLLLGRRLAHQQLVPGFTPESFALRRREAETRCRANACGPGREDVTLRAIYEHFTHLTGIDPARIDALCKAECDIEAELLRLVPGALDKVTAARQSSGRGVVFISDMYLPADFLRQQLTRFNLLQPGDTLYLSSACGFSKYSGSLFQHVAAEQNVRVSDLRHRGDNENSDIQVPRRLGCVVEPWTAARVNRYEWILDEARFLTQGLSSMVAGASRLARLTVTADDEHHAALRDTAAGVIAPTLIGFVLWVFRRAQAAGHRRLYFLSRDGKLILDVARPLAAQLKLDLDLRYLHGSRQAWHLPAVTQIGPAELEWMLLIADPAVTVRQLLSRVELTPQDIADHLAAHRIGGDDRAQPHVPALAALYASPAVTSLILTRAAARRDAALAYLHQQGLTAGGDWAVVDLGWRGRSQLSLAKLLHAAGGSMTTGYYFGLKSRPADPRAGHLEAYLFDDQRSLGYRDLLGPLDAVMEMFCASDDGTVTGYDLAAGSAVPLTAPADLERRHWGVPTVAAAVRAAAESLTLDPALVDIHADLRAPIARLLTTWWHDPTAAEARAWGSFPHESDQRGAARMPWARPLNLRDIAHAALRGRIPHQHVWHWEAGVVRQSWRPYRIAARLARGIGWRLRR